MWRAPEDHVDYLVIMMKSVQNGRISFIFYRCKGLHSD